MKRLCLYFLAAIFTFGIGIGSSFVKSLNSIRSQTLDSIEAATLDLPCPKDAFTVANQSDATARLVILEASCNGPSWKAQLTLQNTGGKALSGYEIGNIEAYEYKKNVESSQGVSANFGTVLAPGATISIDFGAGFRDGLSYGKPTGSIQTNSFWIKRLEYVDGTTWDEKPSKK